MLFIWVFLPIVLAGHYLLWKTGGNRAANVLLLLASLIFYAWGEPVYILLMLISISVNWAAGCILDITRYKKTVLTLDVMVNLGLLLYFKYAGMAVRTFNFIAGADVPVPEIALPIGISFFTFQALSYVIDVYRGEVEVQRSWFTIALYVSFFPQLIAGPIVKYKDVNRQISDRKIDLEQTALGMRRFTYGLAKKVLIANVMGHCADRIYALPIPDVSSPMVWIASAAYTLQIYYDFSGYSDMAVGVGYLFNIKLPINFNSPYKAKTVVEFWKRWHMSLTRFLMKYVYIPLGGSMKGTARTYVNVLIVFLVSGIWHGAGWTFIVWGLLHGIANGLCRLFSKQIGKIPGCINWMANFLFLNLTWIVFRAESLDQAWQLLGRVTAGGFSINAELTESLLQPTLISLPAQFIPFLWVILGYTAAALAVPVFAPSSNEIVARRKTGLWSLLWIYGLFIISMLSMSGVSTFLYNNF